MVETELDEQHFTSANTERCEMLSHRLCMHFRIVDCSHKFKHLKYSVKNHKTTLYAV